MSKDLWLYGVDPENAYVDLNGSRIYSVSVKSSNIYEISETLKKLGLETEKFLRIFRVYEFDYLRSLSPEERSKLISEASEFILEQDEIKKIRDFCRKAIAKIEEAVDTEDIWKRMKQVPPGGNFYDYIDRFEMDCFDARGTLKPMLAMCEKALELGVKLQVV
ncbi:hypothetical protein ANME2D_02865 [Candidatus Methanoperedens nitroreducens]|uniref:Uncharacterized protein n=1 Tax=Candidatus Methanoperedens nitratireducens TaxID=1392998 RepID=A0A062V621_9EURY|nr:hypothetical protein [Candidatus Methanoperedens nitroreducens]KCZ70840.1 hypothetical protein ANME2D_02865 [Candidatus Methanoperedens nitroreducens]MDJ1420695.1 hypothetical protein [Candidatus Methanoperedens sp.]